VPLNERASDRSKFISLLNKTLSGRYQIEREIGAGGMATVYLSRDIKHDRRVALKVLNPQFAALLGPERFLAEIRVTANLQHPNILPLFDSGEAKGLLFYVMPYIDGESLRARLERERQLPVDEAVRIAIAVAGALEYAHQHGVVHRDLKPENILLEAGQPFLADFGIALAVAKAGGERITQTGLAPGTPQYMSPEQATGARDVDGRSDIYSLAVVTYEMLVGEPPHTGANAQAIIARVITDKPRRLRNSRDRVPAHVDEAVDVALSKLPADRYATANDFAGAISGRVSTPVPIVAWRSAKRVSTVVIAAVVAAVSVLSFVLAAKIRPPNRAAAPRFFSVTLPDSAPMVPSRDPWDIASRALAISRDGRSLVYSTGKSGGPVHLMLARLDAGSFLPLRGTDSAGLPAFSPDGRSVAFRTASQIRRVSLDDGSVSTIGDAGASGLAWLEDGQIYGRGEACLWSMPVSGGPLRRVAPETRCLGGHMSPTQSSDLILFDADGVLMALVRKTGRVARVRGPATNGSADSAEVLGRSPFLVAPDIIALLRNSSIHVARFDAKSLRLLNEPVAVLASVRTDEYGAQVAMSEDGTLVWAQGNDATRGKFVWVSQAGAIRDSLFLPRDRIRSFAVTSDGRRLAYNTRSPAGGNLLHVVSIDTRVIDVVPTPVGLDPLDWFDSDRRLLAMLHRPDGSVRIAVVTWPQGSAVIDTSETEFDAESDDGTRRCLGRRRASLEFWMSATPGRRSMLPGPASWCRFSPDGQHLAWIAGQSLYVARSDSSAARSRIQLAADGADEPRWSADGKSLYFRNANRWYVVPRPGTDGRVTSPRLLFQGHFLQAYSSWSLRRDGSFLVLVGPDELPARSLNVMTNFPTFVRQRLDAN
jgi:serine/threonine protein kinase